RETPQGGTTRYPVYDRDGRRLYTRGPNGEQRRYVLAGPLQIAEDLYPASGSSSRQYLHSDALGSLVARSNSAGARLTRHDYGPWGETVGATPDGLGYTGHESDPDSGLVYAQQRYYDPRIGRFLTPDPVAADAGTGANFNRYGYAKNNPYRFTDPDGRSAWSKLLKLALNGGNVAQTLAGLVDDARTLANPEASAGTRVLAGLSIASEALPVSVGDFKDAARGVRAIAESGADAARSAKPLLGRNPVSSGTRTNTDLPGDLSTAKSIFRNQTRGQDVTQTTMSNGGVRRTAADGTQIRINPDGSARLDLPGRGNSPNGETIQIPPRP
ncbi:MAG: RHS repeat-associated core domain-containing protein, partial [Gammaproteobacteria bacterium]